MRAAGPTGDVARLDAHDRASPPLVSSRPNRASTQLTLRSTGMRAFALDAFGEPGSVQELPAPEPADGQVRVRVAAASINPGDSGVTKGFMKDYMEHRFPLVPGLDLAGAVDAVGPGVEGFSVGDPVFGVTGKMQMGEGTLAELATASAGAIARRPPGLDEVEAASIPLAAVSALMSLEAADPQAGDPVVVVGASGGIGSFAVQLAAARGARVVAVTSAGNEEYVKGLGAVEVIDRTSGDVLDALRSSHPGGVAAIIDTASDGPALARLAQAVREGGTVTSMRGSASPDELEQRHVKGVNVRTEVTTARLAQLATLVAEGRLKVPNIRPFVLDHAGEALDLIGRGGVRGKLVVTI